jgi:UDP-N-acetylglucosamine 3-dehydrogenase
MRRLRTGVIGCGAIAQKGHIPAILRSDKAELVAIADIDPELLEKTARRFKVAKTFTDYQAMLEEKLDMVNVCVPSHLHSKVAIDALKRGINVLVEKPIATKVKDAREIVKTADAEGVKLCEAKQWRYIPALRNARDWYSHGKLGRLVSILAQWHLEAPLRWSHAQWYYDREKAGGGIVSDIGIHMLDLLMLFGGHVERVTAAGGDFTKTMGLDSSVQALLEFKEGGTGFLDVSWFAPISKIIEIVGTAGIATVDMQFYSAVRMTHFRSPLGQFFHSAGTLARTARRVANGDFFNPLPRLYSALIDDYYHSITDNKPSPITGEASIEALELKEAIYESISQKTAVTLTSSL